MKRGIRLMGNSHYAHYQPQFLDEFVLDNTNPAHSSIEYVGSIEMRSAAREALELSTRGDAE